MTIQFEFVRNDESFDNAKIYKFEAIHVTTTRNKRRYTLKEMELGARSLAFRPLNRNHDHSQWLPHPENTILATKFDKQKMAVTGEMRITDNHIISLIEQGKIKKLSIEQVPTEGESCDNVACEQNGVIFTGMALLDVGIEPGDERAEIKHESFDKDDKPLEDVLMAESSCRIINTYNKTKESFPELKSEKIYEICADLLGPMTQDEAWKLHNLATSLTPEQAWKEYNQAQS